MGDAIYYARYHTGNEPFAVLLGDTVIDSVIPVTQQLIDAFEQYNASVLAVEKVPRDKVSRYGIIGGNRISDKIMEVSQFVEKPDPSTAPSDLAIAGRYILTPEIYTALEQTKRGKNNEVQLTDAIQLLSKREKVIADTIEGKRYDIGNKLDFLKTTVEFALRRKEFAEDFAEFLKETVENLK